MGTETISIRPDLLGDATGGAGTGFITQDSGTNFLRPLNQTSELSADMSLSVNQSNAGLTSPNNATGNRIIASQTINSLTLLGSGAVNLNSGLGAPAGVFAATGLPLTLTAGGGGFLALTNATIGVGAVSTGNVTAVFHVVGAGTSLTLNGSIVSTTAGIVKADAGTLTFNARQYYTGSTTVNGGTLILNGGSNTIGVQPTGTIPTVSILSMNGGTLDLNGTSHIFERIQNNNANAGTGGVIINSGGTAATLTSASATDATFAGSIGTGLLSPAGNAINFVKSGSSTLVLTNVSSYTGSTILRGGQITLQSSGTLGQTSGVTVNFGTLLLNEAGLNPLGVNLDRIPASAPITLNGGTFQQNSGGSLDATGSFNTVILGSGTNTITQGTVQSAGSSALMSIGSLVQQNNAGSGPATVNFLSTNGTLGGGGLSNNQIQIASVTSIGGAALPTASAFNRAGQLSHIFEGLVCAAVLAGGVDKHLGPTHRKTPRDLGVHDFFRGNASKVANLCARDREHALKPINIQIFIPDIVGRGGKHGIEPPVAQHNGPRRVDDKTGLEIITREMPIRFVSIPSKEEFIVLRNFAECGVFRSINIKCCFICPFCHRLGLRIAGQKIFGQHQQLQCRAHPMLGATHFFSDMGNGGIDARTS